VTDGRSGTAILVDPGVRGVGIDVEELLTALPGLGAEQTTLLRGLARHPDLIVGALRGSGLRKAVVVTGSERPPISELRTWGEAGGLNPLGVQVVALDILYAGRGARERSAYAVRLVGAALAALDAPGGTPAARRPVGASLSRRALFRGRGTTWVPVVEVDDRACLGTVRCQRCIGACPEGALTIPEGVPGAPPVVDTGCCTACSACLDACPSGALKLDRHDPGALAMQLRALLQSPDGLPPPSLVISCHGAAGPLHRLGERDGLPGWLALEVTCLGGTGSTWLLAALAAGARTVQVLPCPDCRDRVTLSEGVDFAGRLLTALGDANASRRVGVLPAHGAELLRAILAAGGQAPIVAGAAAGRIPDQGAMGTPALLAAWAVSALRTALGAVMPGGKTQPPVIAGTVTPERHPHTPVIPGSAGTGGKPQPRAVLGKGAPLGVMRAADGCTACGVCARTCPTGALALTAGTETTDLFLNPSACTGCGVCEQLCPESVLEVVPGVDLDLLDRGCRPIARAAAVRCVDCGESIPAMPATVHLPPLPASLAGRCPRCRQAALVASA
jgi:ferredoxin